MVGEHRGQPEDGDDPGGDAPVIPDDEIGEDRQDRAQGLHRITSAGSGRAGPARAGSARAGRAARARPRAARPMTAISASNAPSAPGQLTPAASPLQNTPKAVSMTPTRNFRVFSGTRVSGARTAKPAALTRTTAAIPPTAASGMLP